MTETSRLSCVVQKDLLICCEINSSEGQQSIAFALVCPCVSSSVPLLCLRSPPGFVQLIPLLVKLCFLSHGICLVFLLVLLTQAVTSFEESFLTHCLCRGRGADEILSVKV